jgi:hypothetical protein
MASVPFIFATQTGPIPLSELDANFASLTGPGGASLISYATTSTGGISRLLSEKLTADLPTVKDFANAGGTEAGGGTADDALSFTSCASGAGFVLVPAGNYRIGTNITITTPMIFLPGAIINPATGITVTISNAIDAGDFQIFSNTNGGSFAISGLGAVCRAAWFGILPSNTAVANGTGWSLFLASYTAWAASNGVHCYFPPGNILTNGFSHALQHMTLEGHYAGTLIVNNSTTAYAMEATGGANFNNAFVKFQFGQASGVTPTGGGAIHMQGQLNLIQDITVGNFPSAMYNGVFLDGTVQTGLYHIQVLNVLNSAGVFGNSCVDTYGTQFYAGGAGVSAFMFTGVGGFYVSEMSSFNAGSFAYSFPSGTNQYVFANSWIGDTSGNTNWNILACQWSTFTNCWASTQASTGTNTGASGFFVSSSTARDLTFEGCRALTNNAHGMSIDNGALNIIVNGCNFAQNGRGTSTTGHGIFVGVATQLTITNCQNRGQNGFGIQIGGSTDYLIVSNNNNQGNTAGTLQNNSTGTHNAIGTGGNI